MNFIFDAKNIVRAKSGARRIAALAMTAGLAATFSGAGARAEPSLRERLWPKIEELAAKHGVPTSLIHRIIMRESKYQANVVSRGNYGMMQIKPGTARGMGYSGDASGLLNPITNLTYAVPYLANAYIAAGRDEDMAVRLYAGGYYYQAKRKGLLSRMQTAHSGYPGHPTAPQPIAVAHAPAAMTSAPRLELASARAPAVAPAPAPVAYAPQSGAFGASGPVSAYAEQPAPQPQQPGLFAALFGGQPVVQPVAQAEPEPAPAEEKADDRKSRRAKAAKAKAARLAKAAHERKAGQDRETLAAADAGDMADAAPAEGKTGKSGAAKKTAARKTPAGAGDNDGKKDGVGKKDGARKDGGAKLAAVSKTPHPKDAKDASGRKGLSGEKNAKAESGKPSDKDKKAKIARAGGHKSSGASRVVKTAPEPEAESQAAAPAE